MTRSLEEPFDKHGAVSESRFRLAHCALERVLKFGLFTNNPHATASATHRRLDDNYDCIERIEEVRPVGRDVPGNPYSLMKVSASVYAATGPGVPGTTGTPTLIAMKWMTKITLAPGRRKFSQRYGPMSRALVLSPSESMTSGEGPTNASPACSTLRANCAFSERKPYLWRRMKIRGRSHGGV